MTRCSASAVVMQLLAVGLLGLASNVVAQEQATENDRPASVVEVADRVQLFLDDALIDSMKSVELRLQHPRPAEIAVRRDQPWEDNYLFDPVVLKDGGKYRMWYRAGMWQEAFGPKTYGWPTAYAESDDGIEWTKPALGIVKFNNSTENNLIWAADHGSNTFSVIKDTNPNCLESERYKSIGNTDGTDSNIVGLVSADGLHWRIQSPNPLIKGTSFDTHNILVWDGARKQYAIYVRSWRVKLENNRFGRSISRAVSPDFRTWSQFEPLDLGDSPPEQLYKNAATIYYRRPDLVLMFPKRFMEERIYKEGIIEGATNGQGLSDIMFMFSYDGLRFDRRYMEAFIRPGRDLKNWHDRAIYAGPTLVPTGNGEMSLYMAENYKCPTVRIRRMVLREDGFVAAHAGYARGEIITRPLVFTGNTLLLNHATSAAGSIRVEIQDENGTPLPGFALPDAVEIFGDELERKAAWNNNPDLKSLAGKPVRLRFVMHDADLYSICFCSK